MSKEIDWNTVETVWDYEKEFDDEDREEFYNSKLEYIEFLKKGQRDPYARLLDDLLIFSHRHKHKRLGSKITKELCSIDKDFREQHLLYEQTKEIIDY